MTPDVDRLTEASKLLPPTSGKGCVGKMISSGNMVQIQMPNGEMAIPNVILDPHSVMGRTVFSCLLDTLFTTIGLE